MYFGKRYLNTALQRWVSADPLEIHSAGEADANLYAYVSGKALQAVDPLGLDEDNSQQTYATHENAETGSIDEYQVNRNFDTQIVRHPIAPVVADELTVTPTPARAEADVALQTVPAPETSTSTPSEVTPLQSQGSRADAAGSGVKDAALDFAQGAVNLNALATRALFSSAGSYAEWAGGRINRALDSLRDPAYSPGKESWRQEHRLGAKLFGQLAMAVAPLKLGGGGAANGGAKGLNPFRGKTFEQIDEILRAKGFVLKGPNPAAGKGSYLHPKTGRMYYLDKGGVYKEGTELPHVDVHRLGGTTLPKKKYPLGDRLIE